MVTLKTSDSVALPAFRAQCIQSLQCGPAVDVGGGQGHRERSRAGWKQEHEPLTETGKDSTCRSSASRTSTTRGASYSTTATDWQARVDFDRMRRDRLARARMMMEKHDLGALVCFVGENVRYITGVYQGNWKNNIFIRYCVLPRGGEPVLFETAGSDLECAKIDAPWLNGNIRPAITWKWAETAETMMADRMVAVDHRRAQGERRRERADRHRHLRPVGRRRRSSAPGSTPSARGRRCRARASSRPPTRSSA